MPQTRLTKAAVDAKDIGPHGPCNRVVLDVLGACHGCFVGTTLFLVWCVELETGFFLSVFGEAHFPF